MLRLKAKADESFKAQTDGLAPAQVTRLAFSQTPTPTNWEAASKALTAVRSLSAVCLRPQLSTLDDAVAGLPPTLKSLDVADNKIATVPAGFCARYPQLRHLVLTANAIKSLDDLEGLRGSHITALDIRENPVVPAKAAEYAAFREKVYALVGDSLDLLDGVDKEGDEADYVDSDATESDGEEDEDEETDSEEGSEEGSDDEEAAGDEPPLKKSRPDGE